VDVIRFLTLELKRMSFSMNFLLPELRKMSYLCIKLNLFRTDLMFLGSMTYNIIISVMILSDLFVM
jgi:hypothetical protein